MEIEQVDPDDFHYRLCRYVKCFPKHMFGKLTAQPSLEFINVNP